MSLEISVLKRFFHTGRSPRNQAEFSMKNDLQSPQSGYPGIVTMSSLGMNGRFANQIFQYAFLKVYAKKHGLEVRTPPWVGQYLFGCADGLPDREYPSVKQQSKDYRTDLPAAGNSPLKNVDFRGYFQYHTEFYAQYRELFRQWFSPVDEIENRLRPVVEGLRTRGEKIAGIHARRGDYGYSYYFVTPPQWYAAWLDSLRARGENPVVFIAGDDSEAVKKELADYNPITAHDLEIALPAAPFYPDFYLLTQCDHLAISNSSFSFAAAMLNSRSDDFVRPHLPSRSLISFDPWNSEPIFRDAVVEDYPEMPEIRGSRGESVSVSHHSRGPEEYRPDRFPNKNVLVFYLSSRENYRPILFSTNEVFCGPDCETVSTRGRVQSMKVQPGEFDAAGVLERLPKKQYPDLVVVKADATGRIFPRNLQRLPGKKILILGNTQHLNKPIQRMLEYARSESFDGILSDHKRHHLHYFAEAGFPRVFWLPGLNVNPFPQPEYASSRYPVLFVGQTGSLHPYRTRLLQRLREENIPLHAMTAPPPLAAELYAQSLISLNCSLNGDMNLRVFEVLAAGGFLLTDSLGKESGMDLIFKDGVHYVGYRDFTDCRDKIKYFLRHPEEAKEIAREGRAEFEENHIPLVKVHQLMDFVEEREIPRRYHIDLDPRCAAPRPESVSTLRNRIACYEYVQQLHLEQSAPEVVVSDGVDSRLVEDLTDLPRLRLSRQSLTRTDIEGERESTGPSRDVDSAYRGICDLLIAQRREIRQLEIRTLAATRPFLRVMPIGDEPQGEKGERMLREMFGAFGLVCRSTDPEVYEWPASTSLTKYLLANGRAQSALKHYREMLTAEPLNANPYRNLGVMSLAVGDREGGEALLKQSLELDPCDPESAILLSGFYEKEGEWIKSAGLLLRAAAFRPYDHKLQTRIGECYERGGNREKALNAYGKSLQINPDQAVVNLRRTALLQTTEDTMPHSVRRMKILLINNLFPPQELGGYGRLLFDFREILHDRGHEVLVLTSDTPYLGGIPENEPGIRRSLKLAGEWKNGVTRMFDRDVSLSVHRHNLAMLEEEILRYAPDVCLLGNIDFLGNHETIHLMNSHDLPVVHHLGGMSPGYDPEVYPRSDLYRLACASEWVRDEVWRRGYGLEKIDVVYPGARVREFYYSNKTRLDKLRIAYAGIVLPYKGIHLLVNALLKLHLGGMDFDAVIAGTTTDTAFRDKLVALCGLHGMRDNVRFVGNLDREELKELYRTRNVMVFPSICKEAFGISQVEAMASGVCVLTSGTGGAKEIVEHDSSGVVFESDNAGSLLKELVTLARDPDRWDRLRHAGQRRALECFDIDRSVDRLEELFMELAPAPV